MIGSLEQVMKDFKGGVCDFTKDGQCIGCGQCCSNYLPLSHGEIKDIARLVKKRKLKPCSHSYAPLVVPVGWDLTCPFLDDSKPNGHKCIIYEHRPLICRDFVCNKHKIENRQTQNAFMMKDYIVLDMRETFFGGK